jgi:nitrogen fixation NifU-like protein
MTSDLRALYHLTMLDHSRRPRNRRAIDGGRTAEGRNPLCGDRIVVHARVEAQIIRDVSFEGSACAIAIASASLMTEIVNGHTCAEAAALIDRLDRMMIAPPESPAEDLGSLTALAGIRQFPTRVKCARLPWHALRAVVDGRSGLPERLSGVPPEAVSTE